MPNGRPRARPGASCSGGSVPVAAFRGAACSAAQSDEGCAIAAAARHRASIDDNIERHVGRFYMASLLPRPRQQLTKRYADPESRRPRSAKWCIAGRCWTTL